MTPTRHDVLTKEFNLRPTRCRMFTPPIPTQPRQMSSVCVWAFSREVKLVFPCSVQMQECHFSFASVEMLYTNNFFESYQQGTGADLPIQSNEAMASQWKGGLINHLYLLHVHGDPC